MTLISKEKPHKTIKLEGKKYKVVEAVECLGYWITVIAEKGKKS
jgi:hypothetical protein